MKNTLIIIGNGFDLAHTSQNKLEHENNPKLKGYFDTSYKRYLDYIFVHDFEDRYKKFDEVGNLISITSREEPNQRIGYDHGDNRPLLYDKNQFDEFIKASIENKENYKSKLLLSFVETLSLQNWVDIEEEYFNLLYEKFIKNESTENIEIFNNEFERLINGLNFYLQGWESTNINAIIDELFSKLIKKYSSNSANNIKPVHILNFNFTPTVEQYTEDNKSIFDLNYIHGKIGDKSNPIVFGYGNEADKRYIEIEEDNKKEYLKYFKSYAYSKTKNYQNLLSFIEAEPFEVIIMGHSCGNSDGVILKTIFEHENCKEIEIKFHQKTNDTTDFDEKAKNIASHFTDKAGFRKKIKPFLESKALVPLLN